MALDPALLDPLAVGLVWWTLGAASAVAARRFWAARRRAAETQTDAADASDAY